MTSEFVRSGRLMDLDSYPRWAQDLVEGGVEARRGVVGHELFVQMREARLGAATTHNFMAGVWPTIERFPQYMALNLLKIPYGRTRGQDMARRYLIHNIRVELKHADYWIDWAEACGVSRKALLVGAAPLATQALSHWCWHVCERESLATGMAATNYAIEGVTGEWSLLVCGSDAYERSFPEETRIKAMKWLRVHAQYDDSHPWEALDIICTLLGTNPAPSSVAELDAAIHKSYAYMRMTLDHCLAPRGDRAVERGAA
jgi:pyrroloquinoline quinone (PQQ) biosynthesis protein C